MKQKKSGLPLILITGLVILAIVLSSQNVCSKGCPTSSTTTTTTTQQFNLLVSNINLHYQPQVGLLAVAANNKAPGFYQSPSANNEITAVVLSHAGNVTLANLILQTFNSHVNYPTSNCRKDILIGKVYPIYATPPNVTGSPAWPTPSLPFSQQIYANVTTSDGVHKIINDNYCPGAIESFSTITKSFEDTIFDSISQYYAGNITGAKWLLDHSATFWDGYGFQPTKSLVQPYRSRFLGFFIYDSRLLNYAPANLSLPTVQQVAFAVTDPISGSPIGLYAQSDVICACTHTTSADIEDLLSYLLAFYPTAYPTRW